MKNREPQAIELPVSRMEYRASSALTVLDLSAYHSASICHQCSRPAEPNGRYCGYCGARLMWSDFSRTSIR